MATCGGCNGRGVCPRCRGTGKIEGFIFDEACTACNGTGRCPTCLGRGKT